jgi:hypothetical protein
MLLLHEKAFFQGQALEIELHDDLRYRLSFGAVEYSNNQRTIAGKRFPYAFKSVEQLRYDFERDVRAAGGRLGEDS